LIFVEILTICYQTKKEEAMKLDAFKGMGEELALIGAINGGAVATSLQLMQADKQLIAEVHTPTLTEENYHIDITGNQLRLFVFKYVPNGNDRKVPLFARIFPIPPFVDAEGIEAVYDDGLLRIIAPIREGRDGTKPRIIQITRNDDE
jgi:HSP20 family protein